MQTSTTGRTLTLQLQTKSYNLILERGAIYKLHHYANTNRKVMIITDNGVPQAYLQAVLKSCPQGYFQIVQQGEESKSLAVYEGICQELLRLSFARNDLIVALGGGVVGDLAGFVAATYLRGLDFINIPTTTLAQIDSSIGGKVAVNLAGIKNVIGCFYQPSLVLLDGDTLQTLSKRHYHNGLAEAVKAGLIYDPKLFELFEAKDPLQNLDDIIYRSLLVKKSIVEQDETDQNCRQLLNFGHTIGHGLESYFHLKDLLHGEAVALGSLPMLEDAQLKARVKAVYQGLELPTEINFDKEQVYRLILADKKIKGDTITLVKVKELGKGFLETHPLADLKSYL